VWVTSLPPSSAQGRDRWNIGLTLKKKENLFTLLFRFFLLSLTLCRWENAGDEANV